tara:strand:+ start:1579 stop:1746 length:168 start_codon:yes stop_codon:yes gene_type:complete
MIGNALESWSGEDLQRLHRDVCGSQIVYAGDSLFAASQETLDRAKEIAKKGTADC